MNNNNNRGLLSRYIYRDIHWRIKHIGKHLQYSFIYRCTSRCNYPSIRSFIKKEKLSEILAKFKVIKRDICRELFTDDKSKIFSMRSLCDKLTFDQRSHFHFLRTVSRDLVIGFVVSIISNDER